jgi:hypothetical protein
MRARERESKVFLCASNRPYFGYVYRYVCVCVLEFQREKEIKAIVFGCVLRDEEERGMEKIYYKLL